MQRSWLRLLISVFIIIAALTGGAANGLAVPNTHPCAELAGSNVSHDAHSNHAPIPRHCDSLICGAIQLTPVFVVTEGVATHIGRLPQPRDDAMRLGFTGPPDLRPPIS